MWPYLATTEFGNPSSHHELGRPPAALDAARASVAGVLGCRPVGDHLHLRRHRGRQPRRSRASRSRSRAAGTSSSAPIEHQAVLEIGALAATALGFEVTDARRWTPTARGLARCSRRSAAPRHDARQHPVRQQRGRHGPADRRAGCGRAAEGRPVPHRRRPGGRLARPRRRRARRPGPEHLRPQARRAEGRRRALRGRWVELEPLMHGGGQEPAGARAPRTSRAPSGWPRRWSWPVVRWDDRRSRQRSAVMTSSSGLRHSAASSPDTGPSDCPETHHSSSPQVIGTAEVASRSCSTSNAVASCVRRARPAQPAVTTRLTCSLPWATTDRSPRPQCASRSAVTRPAINSDEAARALADVLR